MAITRPLNRPWETGNFPGPQAFKTYQILAPIRTHRRRATCAEVDCVKRARGFRAQFDVSTIKGRDNASYIERCGLRFTRSVEGPMVTYTFPAGQNCFDSHTVPLEREPLYVVRGGDHRGNPRNLPKINHRNARNWVDDFGEHQEMISTQRQRG
jgi:hypothetical protein